MGTVSTEVLYALSTQKLEKLWLGYSEAFVKAAGTTEPRGATVEEAKPFSTGWGVGKGGQSLKANLWETDWKSKSWNQSALFYSQDGELE